MQLSSQSAPSLQQCMGFFVTEMWDSALVLVKAHTIGLSLAMQPIQVPLKGLSTPRQIDTFSQLGVICKLIEGALNALIQATNEYIEQNRPQYHSLGSTTHDPSPTGFNFIHHHSLGSSSQPEFLSSKEYSC